MDILTEFGVDLETRFAVFQSEVEAGEFGVTGCSVTVDFRVLWIALNRLRIVLQCARVVGCTKQNSNELTTLL